MWHKALYTDFRKMVELERPDVVCLTTRPEQRAEIAVALPEIGVKAIFATKPMCRRLAEADAMIDACRVHGGRSSYPVGRVSLPDNDPRRV